jgi:hypothetical protein
MNRAELLRAAELAETAATYAALTASHSNIKPEMAERYARVVEDTLYAALDALALSRLSVATEADWRAVTQSEQKEAA